MVDAAGRNPEGANDIEAHIVAADAAGHQRYRDFTARAVVASPQRPLFVEAWARETGANDIFVVINSGQNERLWLPLSIERDRFVTTARMQGDSHANASFPAYVGEALPADALARALTSALQTIQPTVDVLLLERLDPARDGRPNPLAALPGWQSPNPALGLSLEGGFDGVLSRVNGKRKRKKHRAQVRKFEEAGGYRLLRPSSPDDLDELLEFFFRNKAEQFRRMGVADVFADSGTRSFLRNLYVSSLDEDRPTFVLDGLEVGGSLRAVTGSSISGPRITCDVAAIADDELASASPGDFLFFENIRRACEAGFDVFDFGVGDERYKREWCDIVTTHRDVAIALTARGHLATGWRRTVQLAKRRIKGNEKLWTLLKRLRRSA